MEILSPRPLKIASWLVLATLTGLGLLWQGRQFAAGILIGGLLAVINFHLLDYILKGSLGRLPALKEGETARAKAAFALRQLLRFFALLAIIYLLIRHGWVNVFGLLVGLSTVVLTLILAAIVEVIKLNKKEVNPSHGTPHSVS